MSAAGGILVSLILAAAAGVLYQVAGARRGRRLYPPPGTMIDAAGQPLHVMCAGSGRPAVFFESGIAASSLSWTRVLRDITSLTRACAYDRAGLGWSPASRVPRTIDQMLREMHGALTTAAAEPPYVLVGHSFGAWLVSIYAFKNPTNAAGVVLLDPPSEWDEITRDHARLLWGGIQLSRIGGLLARLGVIRACLSLLTGGAPGVPRNFARIFGPTAARTLERLVGEVRKLPPDVHPVVQSLWCQPKCFRAMADHLAALRETVAAAAGVRSLPDVPLVIISSGTQPAEVIAKHRALAHLSSRSRHIVATGSGHWIQFDEPELVVKVIRELVEAIR